MTVSAVWCSEIVSDGLRRAYNCGTYRKVDANSSSSSTEDVSKVFRSLLLIRVDACHEDKVSFCGEFKKRRFHLAVDPTEQYLHPIEGT